MLLCPDGDREADMVCALGLGLRWREIDLLSESRRHEIQNGTDAGDATQILGARSQSADVKILLRSQGPNTKDDKVRLAEAVWSLAPRGSSRDY